MPGLKVGEKRSADHSPIASVTLAAARWRVRDRTDFRFLQGHSDRQGVARPGTLGHVGKAAAARKHPAAKNPWPRRKDPDDCRGILSLIKKSLDKGCLGTYYSFHVI